MWAQVQALRIGWFPIHQSIYVGQARSLSSCSQFFFFFFNLHNLFNFPHFSELSELQKFSVHYDSAKNWKFILQKLLIVPQGFPLKWKISPRGFVRSWWPQPKWRSYTMTRKSCRVYITVWPIPMPLLLSWGSRGLTRWQGTISRIWTTLR